MLPGNNKVAPGNNNWYQSQLLMAGIEVADESARVSGGDASSPRARIPGDPTAAGFGRELAVARAYVPAVTGRSDFPVLTRTNYGEWVVLMEVMLQARGLWPAIEGTEDLTDEIGYRNDRSAMEAILRSVPPDMLPTLAVKKTAQEAWNSIKTIRMGSTQVRDAKAQTLRREFEQLKHKPGESIDELSMRLTGLVSNLSALGDETKEKHVMQKFCESFLNATRSLPCRSAASST